MGHPKDNILHGPSIPKYILDSQSNLSQYLIRMLSDLGNKTSLIDGHDGSSFTFENILNASYNIASWLKYECGIQKSDIVGIFSENTIWYPSLILGVWHIGAVCALFNPVYTSKELEHVFHITKPKMMVTSKMGLDVVRDTAKKFDFIKYVCPIDIICNTRMIQDQIHFVPTQYDNSQTCVILFSSGTTGLPKGVELTHKSVLVLTALFKFTNTFVTTSDILMGIVPMFHGYGLLVMCMCMAVGSKILVLKYFEGELFLKSIEDHRITILFAVPPLMVFLAKHPLVGNYNLSCLNAIYCGAAPLAPDIENEVTKRLSSKDKPPQIFQGYGMTELSVLVTFQDEKTTKVVHGSVGQLIHGMSGKVVDLTNGKSLGINQIGELCFKGPLVMKGYYKNPEATSETIDTEGWLHSGDVGYYDKDYNFFIVDRLKELIKYKGYQVAPAELESILLSHPEIDDAAVTGLPNVDAGELPMAFVVKSPESNLSEKDVINFVHKQVSAQKRLRGGVKFVDSIPKNPSGKILRRLLKELINQSKL